MTRYVSLYGFLFLSHLKSMLEYKASFWLSFLSMIATTGAGLVTIGVVFTHVEEIAGWTFPELFFLYALSIIGMSFHHAFTNSVIYLDENIRDGTFDQFLCLPVNTLFYLVARRYTPLGLGNLVVGIVYLVVAARIAGIDWGVANLLFLVVVVVSGNAIWFAIMLFIGTASFWVTRTHSVCSLVISIYELTRYPLSIYGLPLRGLLTFILPYAFVAYYPALFLLGKKEAGSEWGLLSPLVAVVLVLVSYQFWKQGIRSYRGTGS
ncbi:MAG: ABC-2 family transporter protein [Gemmatimonadaceae bacterium]|nr:ABC-2 family transporter protein [Gemmatimonadaceae bacterium]